MQGPASACKSAKRSAAVKASRRISSDIAGPSTAQAPSDSDSDVTKSGSEASGGGDESTDTESEGDAAHDGGDELLAQGKAKAAAQVRVASVSTFCCQRCSTAFVHHMTSAPVFVTSHLILEQ